MASSVAIELFELANLPPLAWCARWERRTRALTVVHGADVEKRTEGFVEGAWASDFSSDDFDITFMTGTGAKRLADRWRFVAPSHTLDRLCVLRTDGAVYLSNSLPFVLAQSGERLDPDVVFYNNYLSSIRFGLKHYKRSIPTQSGRVIELYYACNLDLTDDGSLVREPKPRSPDFHSYAEYRSYLDATVAAITRNAADDRRKARYAPLATASRGYDSVAAMAIARSVGCTEVVTFRESRGTVGEEDCGTPLALRLGMTVKEFGRLDYRRCPDFPEIENSGGPNEFLSFGNTPRRRLLFTGFHGDKLWDKHCAKVTRDIVRGDASGASLTEYRLRVGFYHLPIPFIGVDSHPSIHAISNSEEMRPWSLGNLYDRPIARRIAEEAGIPREWFGQRKRAAGVVVSLEGLEATMSERSLQDFRAYVRDRWTLAKALKVNAAKLIKLAAYLNRGAGKVVDKIAHACRLPFLKVPDLIPRWLALYGSGYLGKETLLFHWGVERLMTRYDIATPLRNPAKIEEPPTQPRTHVRDTLGTPALRVPSEREADRSLPWRAPLDRS